MLGGIFRVYEKVENKLVAFRVVFQMLGNMCFKFAHYSLVQLTLIFVNIIILLMQVLICLTWRICMR